MDIDQTGFESFLVGHYAGSAQVPVPVRCTLQPHGVVHRLGGGHRWHGGNTYTRSMLGAGKIYYVLYETAADTVALKSRFDSQHTKFQFVVVGYFRGL